MEGCPGAANLKTPTLAIRRCPQCGEEIEIFSNEVSASCGKCGFVVYSDTASCIRWCRYAEGCVGPDIYRKFREAEKEKAGGR